MIELAIISGTGFYDLPGLESVEELRVDTKFGDARVSIGEMKGKKIGHIARHGRKHIILPNLINYRANLQALKNMGAKALLLTTVCGVLKPEIPLCRLVVFDDIYFPENRLPGGEACTIYDEIGEKARGHYIFQKPFSDELRRQMIEAADDPITQATYAYVTGPRFNSQAEIRMLSTYASFVSQTAGPEVILAGELEIPCVLIGFGVDYANGVQETPTPISILRENLKKSKTVFSRVITKFVENFREPGYDGFVYRFE